MNKQYLWIYVVLITSLGATGWAGVDLETQLAQLEKQLESQMQTSEPNLVKAPEAKPLAEDKILAERLQALEAGQQQLVAVVGKTDTQFSQLQNMLSALETKLNSQSDPQLVAKLTALDKRLQALEKKPVPVKSDITADAGPNAPVAQMDTETVTAEAMPSYRPGGWERDTLTDGFWGLADKLDEFGVELATSMTHLYQNVLNGGIDGSPRDQLYTGSYDLELSMDMARLINLPGGTLYVHGEGSFPNEDLDADAVGSVSGINADAAGNRSLDLTEVWYQQDYLDKTLSIRLGKLDIAGGFDSNGSTVAFDGSAYANDETEQFINGALVNNPAVPLPDKGLGAVLFVNPVNWWYAAAGAVDAEADARTSGFNTAFDGDSHWTYLYETGITPQFETANGTLSGAYRIGAWNDSQPKGHSDASDTWSDDWGIYLSCDQQLYKENDDPDDTQGLGGFFRHATADEKRNDIETFWSVGLSYQGLFPSRDEDVLAVGWAQMNFSDLASSTYTASNESVVEVYYNAPVSPGLNVTPSLQYITNPGGDSSAKDTLVGSLRAQMAF